MTVSIRTFSLNDLAAIESLYRAHLEAEFVARVRRSAARVLARPLLSAVYASLALVASAQLILTLTPAASPTAAPPSPAVALAAAISLHALFFAALALYVRYRHRHDVDAAVRVDLGLRLQRYATAATHWHLLLVAVSGSNDNQVVGWIGATFSPVHNAVQIDTFGVAVAHRRRGVGRALLRASEQAAVQRAVRRLDVVLRAPVTSPSLAALLCADDSVAPDDVAAPAASTTPAAGDDVDCDLPAARLFHSAGFRPAKRIEPSGATERYPDAFELWRKTLAAGADEKPHND